MPYNVALVVVDMPFGSYQANPFDGVRNAIRMMKETGADALKAEGGEEVIDVNPPHYRRRNAGNGTFKDLCLSLLINMVLMRCVLKKMQRRKN